MGLLWSRYASQKPPQAADPFRISELPQEELVLHKLQYLKHVLVEQKEKSLQSENREMALAKELCKSNASEAKYHLQKAKICEVMKNRIADRILLVTKQIHNVESMQQNASFYKTIEDSNKVLAKLTDEVNTDALMEAIALVDASDSHSNQLQALLERYNVAQGADMDRELEELSDPAKVTFPAPTTGLATVEDLEKKERMLH